MPLLSTYGAASKRGWFTKLRPPPVIDYLIAGGGGGGGASGGADGGNAGQLATGTTTLAVGAYAVVVGVHGDGSTSFLADGADGTASSVATLASAAGGAGGKSNGTGGSSNGGSGAGGLHSGSVGGPGVASSISGASVTYCHGGDGFSAVTDYTTPGSGGRGSGPGGGGKAGIDGVVIIAYPTGSMTGTGGTITTAGGYTIHTFTANGTFTRIN